MSSKITIHDVARQSGVSIKTVSRVLNREPNVKADTRDRVQAAVAALHYRPNISARSLAGSKAYLIGVFFDNPSPGYITDVQLGAIARCREEGRLQDGAVKQPLRQGRGEMGQHRAAAGGLAEERDRAGIAADGGDVA